jgi:hypothetical protein
MRKAISKPWTFHDVSALKELAEKGTPARTIAVKFGRTLGAVQARASAERISLRKVFLTRLTRNVARFSQN